MSALVDHGCCALRSPYALLCWTMTARSQAISSPERLDSHCIASLVPLFKRLVERYNQTHPQVHA